MKETSYFKDEGDSITQRLEKDLEFLIAFDKNPDKLIESQAAYESVRFCYYCFY